MTTVITLNGLGSVWAEPIAGWLMASALRGDVVRGNTQLHVSYNSFAGNDTNINDGVTQLDTAISATAGNKIVFTMSLGSLAAAKWLAVHGPTSDVPPGELSFILLGNPARRYNGYLHQTALFTEVQWWEWSAITSFYVPVDTPYDVIDFAIQYDGVCDCPDVINTSHPSFWNAAAGLQISHGDYQDRGFDDDGTQTFTEGNITYLLGPQYPMPLCGTWLNSISEDADRKLRPVVEADYTRPYGPVPILEVAHLVYHEDKPMALTNDFEALLCEAYTSNVDSLSLHTANPSDTGENDSGIEHVALAWSDASGGISSALAELSEVSGDFTHVGLWEGATFRQAIPCEINYSAPVDLRLMVTHRADEAGESLAPTGDVPTGFTPIMFDAPGNGGPQSISSGSHAWSTGYVTISGGPKRELTVVVHVGWTTAPTSVTVGVTHDGVSMTSKGRVYLNNSGFSANSSFIEMFTLLDPTSGLKPVIVTTNASQAIEGSWASSSWINVGSLGAFSSGYGTEVGPALSFAVPSAVHRRIIYAVAHESYLSIVTNQFNRSELPMSFLQFRGRLADAPGDSSLMFTATRQADVDYCHMALELLPV